MKQTSLTALLMVMLSAATAYGDAIILRGTNIPIPCSVQRIEAGRVMYVDGTGRSQLRDLEDVDAISFAELDDLDKASDAIRDDEYARAIPLLKRALLHAANDMQRLWIHALLARAHDIRGQSVQAAGHFAAVLLLEAHPYWRTVAPVSEMNEPSFAAASEAMHLLRQARRQVDNAQLITLLDQFIRNVQPVHDRLEQAYDGPPIELGTTVSGVAHGEILQDDQHAESDETDDAPEQSASPEPPARASENQYATTNAIERLLEAERWTEAIEACKRVAKNPGRRDLAQFQYQFGRALLGAGRHGDAAVLFTRCAILHRGSPYASLSLVETAVLYRDVYERPATTRRLLDRAEAEERAHGRERVMQRIAEVRRSLPED